MPPIYLAGVGLTTPSSSGGHHDLHPDHRHRHLERNSRLHRRLSVELRAQDRVLGEGPDAGHHASRRLGPRAAGHGTQPTGRVRAGDDRAIRRRGPRALRIRVQGQSAFHAAPHVETLLGDKARRVRLAPLPPSTASAPYSKDELAELRAWARLSTGARRKTANVLIALGVGAGLSAGEVVGVTRRDIVADGSKAMVTVRGTRPRVVLMERAWAETLLRAVVDLEPGDWVFGNGRATAGKNLVTNFIAKTTTAGLAPNTQRMRATWIVNQLQAGVGAVPLMRSAGVASLEAITRYVQFVDEAA